MPKLLTLVRGLPGSGKSTFVRSYFDCLHVEADMFFETSSGYKFDRSKLVEAHNWCFNTAKEAVLRGQRVVVANTFSRVWELEPYLALTDSVAVFVCTGSYKSKHGVSEATVEAMKKRWEDHPLDTYV